MYENLGRALRVKRDSDNNIYTLRACEYGSAGSRTIIWAVMLVQPVDVDRHRCERALCECRTFSEAMELFEKMGDPL